MTTWIWHQEELVEESVRALTNERWELSHAVYNVERDVVTLYRKWVWYMKIIPDVFKYIRQGMFRYSRKCFETGIKQFKTYYLFGKFAPLWLHICSFWVHIFAPVGALLSLPAPFSKTPAPPPPLLAQSWKNTRCKYTTEHSIRSCSSSVFGNICLTNGIGDPIFVCWNQILDRSKLSQVSNCQMQNQKWIPANGIHFWFCAIQNFRSYVPSSPPPCL